MPALPRGLRPGGKTHAPAAEQVFMHSSAVHSCSIDKMRQTTTLCESVCVFAQVLDVLNHLEFVNCYHVCLDVHKPVIKWDNWCLSQAAGS